MGTHRHNLGEAALLDMVTGHGLFQRAAVNRRSAQFSKNETR